MATLVFCFKIFLIRNPPKDIIVFIWNIWYNERQRKTSDSEAEVGVFTLLLYRKMQLCSVMPSGIA